MVQEMAWFDEEGHSSGAVSARLATDASAVRGAVGDQLGLIFQNVVTIIAGALRHCCHTLICQTGRLL